MPSGRSSSSNSRSRSRSNRKRSNRQHAPWLPITFLAVSAIAAVTLLLVLNSVNVQRQADVDAARAAYTPPNLIDDEMPGVSPVVAFIGDSYTAGTGASSPDVALPALIGADRGWNVENFGRGGTGYLTSAGMDGCGQDYCPTFLEVIPEVQAANPVAIVVSGGRNDRGASADAIQAGVSTFFTELRTSFPSATIFVTSPVWDASAPDGLLETVKAAVAAEAERVGGVYLDMAEPLSGRPELMSEDAVHPNDAGYTVLADRANELISASGADSFTEVETPSVASAMELLDDPARPFTWTVIGDSTGNGENEWVYLSAQVMSDKYNRPVIIHNWDVPSNSYISETTVGGGDNAPITVWNGSASGQNSTYSIMNFATMAPAPSDLVIVSHGHNIGVGEQTNVEMAGLLSTINTQTPRPAIAITLQNPRAESPEETARQESRVRSIRFFLSMNPQYTEINVYDPFMGSDLAATVGPDGIHPTDAGEALWASVVEDALGLS
jgi:lysophospholipase L1-like esterase